ncbi:hypothetical protein Tco_1396018 [Tanacetum coccineum]
MEQENLQQAALDEALVPIVDQVKIGSCSMRIYPLKTQKEPNYQLTLDILKQYSCYNAFIITVDVPQTYMQQFWCLSGKSLGIDRPRESRIQLLWGMMYKKNVADTAESEETYDDEVQLLIRRSTGVFIGIEIPKEKTKDAFDHSKKLKGMETLPAAAQLVPDEPKDISGNSSSSRSGFDDETKDISSNDEIKAEENKAKEGKDTEEQSGEEPLVDE